MLYPFSSSSPFQAVASEKKNVIRLELLGVRMTFGILLIFSWDLPGWENIGEYHMTFGIPLGHLTNYWLLRSTKYVPAADIGVNKIECLNTTCPLVVKGALAHTISFHIKYIKGPASII